MYARPLDCGVRACEPADFENSVEFEQVKCVLRRERYYRLSVCFRCRYSFDEDLNEVVWRLKVGVVVKDEIFVTLLQVVPIKCRKFTVVFASKHFT
jgi:hypothetical protein